ncbi:MAG: HAMP domain-containing sensor histidine kinase, partial [Polyangiaceae bacterium]
VVKDTGTGILPDNLLRIFLPFFTTKASGRGTGLGLSIVKKIIESHGGSITVESKLTVGTSFVICLPTAVC